MGAGLYPPPSNTGSPRGVKFFATIGSTAYVGDTETRAYLATWKAEADRLYRITMNVGSVDTDAVGDVTSGKPWAKNSAIIRGRWAYGTDATVASADAGYMLATVFDDDSQYSSGTTATWHLGGATAGDVSWAITIKSYKAAATYGMVRLLATGGASNLFVEDVGPWPIP
ncbi:hypothetical protein FDG66_gp24 [Streptomyces phage phiCAM]|uniref:DUF7298 domain-containing protein n=1 Tax=Streptomyces phage phiCAM TaxID=1239386 RepID=K4NX41_9CAUD|nr:hypothetical protein FDG66_gp24 [Streptomyces phage phiCAM]AFV51344.1 hypothetical protein [Streptomyces phage phiCAM]